jgi:hypothetical protein
MAMFQLSDMGGMSMGGYPLGGVRKGEKMSESQREKLLSQDAIDKRAKTLEKRDEYAKEQLGLYVQEQLMLGRKKVPEIEKKAKLSEFKKMWSADHKEKEREKRQKVSRPYVSKARTEFWNKAPLEERVRGLTMDFSNKKDRRLDSALHSLGRGLTPVHAGLHKGKFGHHVGRPSKQMLEAIGGAWYDTLLDVAKAVAPALALL